MIKIGATCLCLLAICSSAAASRESQTAATTNPYATSSASSDSGSSVTRVPSSAQQRAEQLDKDGAAAGNAAEAEEQSLWSQQPDPKVALLDQSRSKILASAAANTNAYNKFDGVNANSNSNDNNIDHRDSMMSTNQNVVLESVNGLDSDKTNQPANTNPATKNAPPSFTRDNSNNDPLCRPSMADTLCRPLLAAQEMDAGQVCIAVQDGQVSVDVQANEFWTILEAHIWMAPSHDGAPVNSNMLNSEHRYDGNSNDMNNIIHPRVPTTLSNTQTVPLKDGRLDLTAFTISSQPNLHSASWKTTMTSTVDCSSASFSTHAAVDSNDEAAVNRDEEVELKSSMIIRVLMAEVDDEGNMIPGTEEIAFAYGHVASTSANSNKYDEDSVYGFIDLSVRCPCTNAPLSSQDQELTQNTETYVAPRFGASASAADIDIDIDGTGISMFSSAADRRRLAFSASQTAFHRRFDAAGQQHRVLQTQVEEECFHAFAYYNPQDSSCLKDLSDSFNPGFSNGPYM